MSSLTLKNIKKQYGDVEVVKGFDLEVDNGEFIVLLGASGCGKSTTLRMIAGLESITSGDLLLGERRINDVDAKDRDLAMVFQSYALYPHMTVYENIAFALKLRRMSRAEIDERVRWAAELLHLTPLLNRQPKALSGGQRQRVAMGRAMVRTPSVFLFDEPLSNLDAKLRHQMRTEIKALHQKLGTTTIYVTHDQTEAMTLADRIVIMDRGVISQIGTPHEVFNEPANLFVAQFIGNPAMNLFSGVISRQDGKWQVDLGHGALLVPERMTEKCWSGLKVRVGIRPTDIHLRAQKVDHSEVQACPVKVRSHELLGATRLLNVDLADATLGVEVPAEDFDPCRGELELFMNMRALHLFDEETGQSLA
jgi:multiple sugar transport system ATP-binding protein